MVVVPAGQRRYSRILARYLEVEPEVDEVRWCLNTADPDDAAWIRALPARRPDLHTVVDTGEVPRDPTDMVRLIAVHMDREGRGPDTLYVRLDHDIVFITRGLVGRLARAAWLAAREDRLMVFPYVVNAPHRRSPAPEPAAAEELHRRFLRGELVPPPVEDVTDGIFSANVMAWYGPRLPSLDESLRPRYRNGEEPVLTTLWAQRTGRPHRIDPTCGTAVHFSFHWQRDRLDATDLLGLYEDLCRRETGLDPV